ncbi:Zinc finger RING-type domain-containing protein [Penicillium ucsense]|uniref:Zinc finger RING-type domain-containing protein n=1 Tax=Penicillium ucsense TaxID=2839758 RepID=A0A8J8VWN1_9EURO|nr:Zinc finger RING-type domain-containing protein [Penicillium ucsense]KAF7730882.1 Zinc finger RING-type domain-containing protein [Penicillium ucsense]
MSVVAETCSIPGLIPENLISAFAQVDSADGDERPRKRRRSTKSSRTSSVRYELGCDSNDVPIGYIPLAKLSLRLTYAKPLDSDGLVTYSGRLPVLVALQSAQSPRLNHADNIDGCAGEQLEYTLHLSTSDDDQEPLLSCSLDFSQQCEFVSHARQVTSLVPADRYYNRPPTACYQASVQLLMEDNCVLLEVLGLWRDSLDIPDFNHLPDSALEFFWKYALHEEDATFEAESQRQRREQLLGFSREWSPREFYENVHVPRKTEESSAIIESPNLECDLFPFQRRAVRWLLWREGFQIQQDGSIGTVASQSPNGISASFKKTTDVYGNICYFSHLFMTVTTELYDWGDTANSIHGGILAEEMGLGKTVEMIALIDLNRRPAKDSLKPDHNGLRISGATLIITPPAILEQWEEEIQQHAPKLRVYHYTGIKRSREQSDDLMVEEIADFDIVLTTYNVISREIHYAGATPGRSLRHEKRFEPRKTPLVRIAWWRVCLDEAQMIESGVSNAAKVARLIPRRNAWAVTGTPLRKNIDDLFGLLLFLQYRPFCDSSSLWKRLYSLFGPVLVSIINSIALRHSKDKVRDELRLPPQKRIVITVPFTPIEEQHYGQLFEEMCDQCGLDTLGAPLTGDWNPEDPVIIERMRAWLTRLRQTCLHPEVSGSNRRALGAGNGPLRTVDEVLEVMIETNDSAIRAEERTLLLTQLRRGQLLENAKRKKEALALWQSVLDHASKLANESREQLRLERVKVQGAAGQLNSTIATAGTSADLTDDESEGEVDKNSRIGQCRLRLRASLEVQHIAVFFTANAYYQIKSDPELTAPDSEEYKALEKKEEEAYEAAKLIRKEMLRDISRKVEQYLKRIREKARNDDFVRIPTMQPYLYSRGIESYRLLNKFEDLCAALNQHAEQYTVWREAMTRLVSQSLIDQEEDAELEGNEYERSTKHQDEMYVYMEALRAMYADRHDALTGQKNILISHETRAGISQAKKGEGPSPELFLSIMSTRSELMPKPELGSLRGIVSELRSLVGSLDWQASGGSSRAGAELEMVTLVLKNAGQILTEQLRTCPKIEREVELFRDTMNNRLEYYRHLQQISDTVAPYDEESAGKPLDQNLFESKLEQEEKIYSKISSLKSKRRYLIHLRDESGEEDGARICIICQSNFETGLLTVCGHKYCSDCLRLWWREHRTCPVCKKPLKLKDFHQITYKPQEIIAQEEETPLKFDHGKHSKNAIYTDISSGLLKEIDTISLDGSFGTKVDTLARHLLWLREHDPGSKAIVFSQYRNFLTVLRRAFERFGIVSSSVDTPGGIKEFKKNPAIECFLLHGKAQSSGLTLVNATHVFLCEPLINTAIELQAIARVHRIGQHRPTTVWMYLISGTAEESIYELSVTRRLAHILEKEKQVKKENVDLGHGNESLINDLTETAIDSANSLEMEGATLNNLMTSGTAGGELVKKDDLWQCLFGATAGKQNRGLSTDAEREVSRFLRGEAAEQRRDERAI